MSAVSNREPIIQKIEAFLQQQDAMRISDSYGVFVESEGREKIATLAFSEIAEFVQNTLVSWDTRNLSVHLYDHGHTYIKRFDNHSEILAACLFSSDLK